MEKMSITFLGTAAASAYPEAFCQCDNCILARELGGPSLRKRSSALINDDLLIDLGPDVNVAAFLHGRPLTRVRYCIQTHAHADHLDPSHFLLRSPEFGVVNAPRLHFYASAATINRIRWILERNIAPADLLDSTVSERLNLQIHQIGAFQTFTAGPYQVMTFPANHDPTMEPLLYAIAKDGYTIFYGTDTAMLSEDTWLAFSINKLRFSVVVLDHTYGPEEKGSDHLSSSQFVEQIRRMREEGLLADQARIFATHIAHEGNPVHPQLVEYAAEHGYEIAFDGLTV